MNILQHNLPRALDNCCCFECIEKIRTDFPGEIPIDVDSSVAVFEFLQNRFEKIMKCEGN